MNGGTSVVRGVGRSSSRPRVPKGGGMWKKDAKSDAGLRLVVYHDQGSLFKRN
jgi:hypothetical protein